MSLKKCAFYAFSETISIYCYQYANYHSFVVTYTTIFLLCGHFKAQKFPLKSIKMNIKYIIQKILKCIFCR